MAWRRRTASGPRGVRTKVDFGGGREYNFRSALEAAIAKQIESERPAQWDYETERFKYTLKKTYTPDFILKKADGTRMYIEVKGMFTADDRAKMLAVRDDNPGIDIRFLFSNARSKLRKGSKSSYADWCDVHNFKWADGGRVPLQWLGE